MTVIELINLLQSVEDKSLEVFVVTGSAARKSNGVYLVSDRIKETDIPRKCVVVES